MKPFQKDFKTTPSLLIIIIFTHVASYSADEYDSSDMEKGISYLHGVHSSLIPLLLVGIPCVVHEHSNPLLQLRGNGRVGPAAGAACTVQHLFHVPWFSGSRLMLNGSCVMVLASRVTCMVHGYV